MLAFLRFFFSFEFVDLSKMWCSNAVAVGSAGENVEMKTAAVL